ncbi:hypothetical protein PIROE2DRAFT_16605, partial [Piromyces sp. E2]
ELFQLPDPDTVNRLNFGDGLFIKYWDLPNVHEVYKRSIIPGRVKGLSGASLGGTTIAINKYISDNQKKYAVKAVEYITSKKTHKELILDNSLNSSIPSLYHDEDVCHAKNCDIMNSIQLVPRPSNFLQDYDYYSEYYVKYINEFLYKNKTALEVLQNIVDISKIYYIKLDSNECLSGVIVFAVIIIIFLMIIGTGGFVYWKRKKRFFQFLSTQSSPVIVESKIINDGNNFEVCKSDGKSGMFVISILVMEKAIIVIGMILLVFLEWNLIETHTDIRLINAKICLDTFLYIIYIISNAISINQYITYFIWTSLIIITFIITNFSIMYGLRIFHALFNPDKEFNYIRKMLQKNTCDMLSENSNSSNKNNINSKSGLSRLVMYHYYTKNPSIDGIHNCCCNDRYNDHIIGNNLIDKSFSFNDSSNNSFNK